MNEHQLCEFMERWNGKVEESWIYPWLDKKPTRLLVGTEIIDMIDDFIATFDVNAPQWYEAYAIDDRDGQVYWARTKKKAGFWFAGTWLPENYHAQERANYLATRG